MTDINMEKTNLLAVEYIGGDTMDKQGKRKDMDKYIKEGYVIVFNHNGNFKLKKYSKVQVTLNNSFGTNTFDMADDIRNYYSPSKLTISLVRRFEKDVVEGIINLTMNEDGYYSFK